MQAETHESFCESINAFLQQPFPLDALRRGAVAPNHELGWPGPHHLNQRVAAQAIQRCVCEARQHWLGQREADAAHQFGAAVHYALDIMVPYDASDGSHAFCEGEFQGAHQKLRYDPPSHQGLADPGLAQRSIKKILFASSVQPLNYEQRLRDAHANLLNIALAVTETPAPQHVTELLQGALQKLGEQLKAELGRYSKSVKAALTAGGSLTAEIKPGPQAERAVAECAILRANRKPVAPLRRIWARRAEQRFEAAVDQGLAQSLQGDGQQQQDLARRCAALAAEYDERVGSMQKHYSEWQWFDIPWDDWHQKGRRAHDVVAARFRSLRGRLAELEKQRFSRRAVERFPEMWAGTRSERLASRLRARPALVHALPAAVGLGAAALLGLLVLVGALLPLSAILLWILLAAPPAAYLWLECLNLSTLQRYRERAPEQIPSKTGQERGEDVTDALTDAMFGEDKNGGEPAAD